MNKIISGTVVNYYFHCKRQCYLFANKLNMEDNSELVQIGKSVHEIKENGKENTEIQIDNIVLDRITKDYVIEIKKSDADIEASKWQLIFYLKVLKDKGINKKGKLIFDENNKSNKKNIIIELDEKTEKELNFHLDNIQKILESSEIPKIDEKSKCKKCAYYAYCYI